MRFFNIILAMLCACCFCFAGCGEEGSESKSDGTSGETTTDGDFKITGVDPDSLVPNQDFFAGESGGNPVLKFKSEAGEAAERDLTFLGKFPSTSASGYTARVELVNRQQADMDRELYIVSVTSGKITIHFPMASGQDGLFGTMALYVKYKDKTASIKVHIP